MKKIKINWNDLLSANAMEYAGANILSVDLEGSTAGKGVNFIHAARKNKLLRASLVKLANYGFCLYKHEGYVSSFVQHDFIENIWERYKSGEVKKFESLFYTLDNPLLPSPERSRLIVVFSSINADIYNSSLSARYFLKNFGSIQKYIPNNTYVLRIADMFGVVGSFYLDNKYCAGIEQGIQRLIASISARLNVNSSEDVILYGASKGGTGALYHAILGGYKAVSIDPIVSDEYYLRKWDDTHFTDGGFEFSKQDKFAKLLNTYRSVNSVCVVYSEHSPQFEYIDNIVRNSALGMDISFFNSMHPEIKDHPDVAPKTMNVATSCINGLFYGCIEKRFNLRLI